MVIDVAMPRDSNLRKEEYEKLEKYKGMKEELEGIWKVKVKVVPVVVGTIKAVIPKLGEWLKQIPGALEFSVQNSAVLGKSKILCAEPSNSQPSGRGHEIEEDTSHPPYIKIRHTHVSYVYILHPTSIYYTHTHIIYRIYICTHI